jgi:hypothetical protein
MAVTVIPTPAQCRRGTTPVIVPSATPVRCASDAVRDLTFVLLPRLPGAAQKAWGESLRTSWADRRDRLAEHAARWSEDELTCFRAKTIDWLR